jgi:hypothetical protein
MDRPLLLLLLTGIPVRSPCGDYGVETNFSEKEVE